MSGVELEDGRLIHRTPVFVRPRFVPDNELLLALGCTMDDHGWVVADAVGRTTSGSAGWTAITLPAGRYELVCNLRNHYANGMHQAFDVS